MKFVCFMKKGGLIALVLVLALGFDALLAS